MISPRAHRHGGRRWIALVASLISMNMLIVFVTVRAAVTDPTFAVEPAFYQKAVDWDRGAAQQAAAERLGWRLTARQELDGRVVVSLTEPGEYGGQRRQVVDADVSIEAFAQARSGERIALHLPAQPDGTYAAVLPARRAGWWELRMTARRGSTVFRRTETLLVGG